MPEIAEVALTAQILDKYTKGKYIKNIEFKSGRYQKKPPANFENIRISFPLKIISVNSKGKFLWIELGEDTVDWYIWNTFGLTGMWSFVETEYV